jgi:hypothetical protein
MHFISSIFLNISLMYIISSITVFFSQVSDSERDREVKITHLATACQRPVPWTRICSSLVSNFVTTNIETLHLLFT